MPDSTNPPTAIQQQMQQENIQRPQRTLSDPYSPDEIRRIVATILTDRRGQRLRASVLKAEEQFQQAEQLQQATSETCRAALRQLGVSEEDIAAKAGGACRAQDCVAAWQQVRAWDTARAWRVVLFWVWEEFSSGEFDGRVRSNRADGEEEGKVRDVAQMQDGQEQMDEIDRGWVELSQEGVFDT